MIMANKRYDTFYTKYGKRLIDLFLSLIIILCFFWLYLIIALIVRIKLGSPVIFAQIRPGIIDRNTGKEKLFKLYKFRSMTNETDEDGALKPDDIRLTSFGKKLRSSSLDEIPEIINIIKGDMSFVGPRPQLVKDMVFMSKEVRQRHSITPGLTGLAQVNGRNNMTWDEKFEYDIEYINNVTFLNDIKIIIKTILKIVGIEKTEEGEVNIAEDYGDYLLNLKRITKEEYDLKILEEKKMLVEANGKL